MSAPFILYNRSIECTLLYYCNHNISGSIGDPIHGLGLDVYVDEGNYEVLHALNNSGVF